MMPDAKSNNTRVEDGAEPSRPPAQFWSTGIIVWRTKAGEAPSLDRWRARVFFFAGGWGGDASEGELGPSHEDALSEVVSQAKAVADQLGIRWGRAPAVQPTVHYLSDGHPPKSLPHPPDGWRERVNAEAKRLGWEPAYPTPKKE